MRHCPAVASIQDPTDSPKTNKHKSPITKKCTRVADRPLPENNVTWRQRGDFNRYVRQPCFIKDAIKMQTSSPYEPPCSKELPLARIPDVRSRKKWKTIGFLIFAFVPVACGIARLYRESVYYASLPPGTAACGMGSLGGMMMIVIGGPFLGLIGAAVGSIASRFNW